MAPPTPHRLPATPPPAIKEALRSRLSGRELQAVEAVFALRVAAQQAETAITEWLAETAGSPARHEIMMLLWAADGRAVPHKAIVAAMGVTRATVSELMTALERQGVVSSSVDPDDRRQLLATLTSKGEAVMSKALEVNGARLRQTFASLSSAELEALTALLQRVREGFAASGLGPDKSNGACSLGYGGKAKRIQPSRDSDPLTQA
jgi:DNA-binding MarR family transcriptional regulator